ncbi:MAG: DUF3987 domain-containing protein [Acidobacteria bacterium]|nr:DUF3987 domain-containing protein [Acidobacteriota bacterium]
MTHPAYFPTGSSYLAERIDYGLQNTDACPLYHLVAGLMEVSAGVRRRVWIPFGDGELYLNLYVCLLGRSGRSRKSTVLKQTRTIVGRESIVPILPEEWSPEGLVKALKETPEGILILPELGHALEQFERKYAHGLRELLAQVWDCPDRFTRRLADKTITLEKLYLSMFTASTPGWFWGRVRPGDIGMGFLSRFLFVPEEAKEVEYSIPPGSKERSLNMVVEGLQKCMQREGPLSLDRITQPYEALYRTWLHQDAGAEGNPLLASLEARYPDYILKLAALYHCAESKDAAVSPEALDRAHALVEQLRAGTRAMMERHYAPTREEQRWKQVLALVEARPGLTERALSQRLHLLVKDREELLRSMEAAGELFREGKGTRGDPRRCYRAQPIEEAEGTP